MEFDNAYLKSGVAAAVAATVLGVDVASPKMAMSVLLALGHVYVIESAEFQQLHPPQTIELSVAYDAPLIASRVSNSSVPRFLPVVGGALCAYLVVKYL